MNPSNNVDVSQYTTVDKIHGITRVGAQNLTSETVSGALLNFSRSTSQVDQLTFQTGVQGGCTQESFVESTDPTPLTLSLTPGEITPLSVVANLDSQPTIVPTPTSDNKDFTPNKTAATGLLLLVQTPEEVHKTLAVSNRGRGSLATFLAQVHSTPNSTPDMVQTRSNKSKTVSDGPVSNRSHLRRNPQNPSKVAGKGSQKNATTGKRIRGSSNPAPSEPPTKKPKIISGSTLLKSNPPIPTKYLPQRALEGKEAEHHSPGHPCKHPESWIIPESLLPPQGHGQCHIQ